MWNKYVCYFYLFIIDYCMRFIFIIFIILICWFLILFLFYICSCDHHFYLYAVLFYYLCFFDIVLVLVIFLFEYTFIKRMDGRHVAVADYSFYFLRLDLDWSMLFFHWLGHENKYHLLVFDAMTNFLYQYLSCCNIDLFH